MNRITHDMTAWGAGIAIGVAIGLSLNNIVLGIGVGAAMGAALFGQSVLNHKSGE